MTKYKYYFRKPKSEIVKVILYWLMVAGAIYVAASSPYFSLNLRKSFRRGRKYEKKKVVGVFYRLRKRGYIEIKHQGFQIYINFTEKEKKGNKLASD